MHDNKRESRSHECVICSLFAANFHVIHRQSAMLLFHRPLLLRFSLREYDFEDEEEYHHGYTAHQYGGADVVQPSRKELACNRYPHTIDRVYHDRDRRPRDHIPHDLPGNVAVAAEGDVSLQREVDALREEGANQHRDKIAETAADDDLSGFVIQYVVSERVPGEVNSEQAHRNCRPAPCRTGQLKTKQVRQEGVNDILDNRYQVTKDEEETALAHPLCC